MSEQHKDQGAATPRDPTAAAPGLSALPARPAGSLTTDLGTDTDDLATLKGRLGRARERLSFYESFDRIIQENIRRSSELMIEATELHERAERATAAQAEAQSALARQRDADRRRYSALLDDLRGELDRTRAALDGISARVTAALAGLASEQPSAPEPDQTNGDAAAASPPPSGSDRPDPAAAPATLERPTSSPASAAQGGTTGVAGAADPTAAGVAAPAASAPEQAPAASRTVEVLVHGVPTARVAISFQNHLRGLDQVATVEAREFVEGLLRLQVTATGDLADAALAGWADGDGADLLRALPDLLEISLPGTTER